MNRMVPLQRVLGLESTRISEVQAFIPAFAMKEYIQNAVAKALKSRQVREWSDWVTEDLRSSSPKEQAARKQRCFSQAFQDLDAFVFLSATILASRLQSQRRADLRAETNSRLQTNGDLQIAIVLWNTTPSGIQALSVFNNHLDSTATFATFAVDGASTSRNTPYTVGHEGKGFILATQFFWNTSTEAFQSRGATCHPLRRCRTVQIEGFPARSRS
ncbi:hypothetical protein B0H14DRAFT_2602388 [Mycena olivaceomarginata]|nr:hypothetical protein B0H14DRAFT_2602388 [Mycena olivaceomarginata]